MKKSTKIIIIVSVVAVIGFAIYYYNWTKKKATFMHPVKEPPVQVPPVQDPLITLI